MIESSSCVLNVLWVMNLSLILSNSSWQIYSKPKESTYTAIFVSINNKTKCVPLLFYHWGL